MNEIAFVTIGRNEGERFRRCIESVRRESRRIVYVDSGSTDGSPDFAKAQGVAVVALDTSRPFNMSRSRNAGFAQAMALWQNTEFIHFLDGDCELLPGWVDAARSYLLAHPEVVAVCGRRIEKFPDYSVFNRLCDIEWNTPIGETRSTGGDALFRVNAFRDAGGFNEELIAGEEPELCLRLRRKGGKIWRIDQDMTLHDANISKLSQWWKRHVRAGYAAADVSRRSTKLTNGKETLFSEKVRSSLLWIIGSIFLLDVAITVGILFSPVCFFGTAALLLLAYGLQAARIALGVRHRARHFRWAIEYGFFTMLAKLPQSLGILKCWIDKKRNRQAKVIEYKNPAA